MENFHHVPERKLKFGLGQVDEGGRGREKDGIGRNEVFAVVVVVVSELSSGRMRMFANYVRFFRPGDRSLARSFVD